jgi:hypothetical protein
MKETLKTIFDNVNEWLKFAEAKHAGLIILNITIIFGIATIHKDYKEIIPLILILVPILFLFISIILTLISFFPKTKNKLTNSKKVNSINLYYFGSLKNCTEVDFKHELTKVNAAYNFDKFDNDLINQILVNSNIACSKYTLFKSAIISTIIGLAVPFSFLLYSLVKCIFRGG